MPADRLTRFTLLPELKLEGMHSEDGKYAVFIADKVSEFEVCPRCATVSRSVYDHRVVAIKDAPIREKNVRLRVRKRRFWCKPPPYFCVC